MDRSKIQSNSSAPRIYDQIRRILEQSPYSASNNIASNVLIVYRDALKSIEADAKSQFSHIESYLGSVNQFLEYKQLDISLATSPGSRAVVTVVFPDEHEISLTSLSSGERQLLSMLYAASLSEVGNMVLIDESELSLHIDWQRMFLKRMEAQLGGRQVIVATHSPEIGIDFEDRHQEVTPIVSSGFAVVLPPTPFFVEQDY